MEYIHQNRAIFAGTLRDVFTSFYSAAVLTEIYRALPPVLMRLNPFKDKLNKALLIEEFMWIFEDDGRVAQFVAALDPRLREAVGILVWRVAVPLDELEQTTGARIARELPRRKYIDPHFKLDGLTQLLVIRQKNRWSYSSSLDAFNAADYLVCLPPALRVQLKRVFPKPALYDWVPLPARPEGGRFFECARAAAADLAVSADFVQRGAATRTKQNKFGKPVLRSLAAMTTGGEFWPGNCAEVACQLTRHELLAEFVSGLHDHAREAMRQHPFPLEKVLPRLVPELIQQPEFILTQLLPHIKLRATYLEPEFRTPALASLFGIFGELPAGEWISAENLLAYADLRDIDLTFFDPLHYRFRGSRYAGEHTAYSHVETHEFNEENIRVVALEPLLRGTAFLLAALGILEINYTEPPAHHAWFVTNHKYVSIWDGLRALRLTPTGAFCFGKAAAPEVDLPGKRDSGIRFNGPRLLAFSKTDDPVTRDALEDFMDRLGPGVYRFSAPKLFKGCFEKTHLAARIEAFRTRIDMPLPPEWEAALAALTGAPAPLVRESGYSVYTLADDPRVRELFAKDPMLRQLCLRVEGWRVAIRADDIKRVREHLRSLGIFLEGDVGEAAAKKQGKASKGARRR